MPSNLALRELHPGSPDALWTLHKLIPAQLLSNGEEGPHLVQSLAPNGGALDLHAASPLGCACTAPWHEFQGLPAWPMVSGTGAMLIGHEGKSTTWLLAWTRPSQAISSPVAPLLAGASRWRRSPAFCSTLPWSKMALHTCRHIIHHLIPGEFPSNRCQQWGCIPRSYSFSPGHALRCTPASTSQPISSSFYSLQHANALMLLAVAQGLLKQSGGTSH